MSGSALLRSGAIVGAMTLISRLLGFSRDLVFANIFGAGAATDAFFVAFKIPNFLRRLFAEGAFSQAFIPVLAEERQKLGDAGVRRLVAATVGTLGVILLIITLLAVVGAEGLIYLFAPGFHGEAEKFTLATEMLRITFPYLFFISLTALAAAILNSYGRFAIPALTPIWLNLVLIGAALGFTAHFQPPIMALAWGVLVAGVVQLLFQLPSLYGLGLLPRPRWGWRDSGVRKILRLMLPAIFGSSVAQINLLLDTVIASFLISGSVSWLYYSDRLVEFPLGLFGIALATVILPALSRHHAAADPETYSATLDWGLRWVMVTGVPAAIGLALLATPILTTLFQYGAFAADDVAMSSLSLMAYAFGLPAFMLVKVLAPGFYARQDTRTPVRFGVIAMVANMGLNLLFVLTIIAAGWQGAHAGLALATVCSASLNAFLLYRHLRREGILILGEGWRLFLLRLLVGNVAMAATILYLDHGAGFWLEASLMQRGTQLLLEITAAAAAYFFTLWLLRMPLTMLSARRL
ncbi:MAG: murein biosynthesis integral membrane protein MurJ [Gammaproteobacteria bacterium]|nr:murein biosynthesis integral membrane protein MurJ [Gammaproteobacteria bacterium]